MAEAQAPLPFTADDQSAVNALGATAPSVEDLSAQESARRAVLDRIASGESPDYSTIYGEHKFSSYADHPRIPIPIEGRPGWHSDAAGRYQFLSSTWDPLAKRLGLRNFSPANQDSAAWDLANSTYRAKTGRDLLQDQLAGKTNWAALGGQWPSLVKAKGPQQSGAQGPAVQGSPASGRPEGVAPQGPPASAASPPAGGLNHLAMIAAMFPQVKFTPISYDPFAVAPKLGTGSGT